MTTPPFSRTTPEARGEHPHATAMDPDAHRIVFENEHIRVIHARASHGWRSAMHSHRPMLVVSLGTGRQKVALPDGSSSLVDLDPGIVVWQDDVFQHSWELIAGEVNVVLVEVKSADASTRGAAATR